MEAPKPIVRISRPQLAPEEREARIEKLKKAVAAFCIACERAKAAQTKGAQV